MELIIKDEDLKEIVNQELLAEKVAEIIVNKNVKDSWNDWKSEFTTEYRDRVKLYVAEYMKDYETEEHIKYVIFQAVKAMGKKEIIELLLKAN